jgi:hypothetical protein
VAPDVLTIPTSEQRIQGIMAYEEQDYNEVIAALGEGSINVEGAFQVALQPG